MLKLITILLFVVCSISIQAQTKNETNIYKAELEAKTVDKIKLDNNTIIITETQMDLNSVWVSNPDYPNIPFGKIILENKKTIIDLSESPKGDYYIQGKKDNIIVAYKLSKIK